MEPNSNYANVSWKHNFPAGSSEFVLEFTLDSKNPDRAQAPALRPKASGEILTLVDDSRPFRENRGERNSDVLCL